MNKLHNDFFDNTNQQAIDERQAIELSETELEQVSGGCFYPPVPAPWYPPYPPVWYPPYGPVYGPPYYPYY